MGISGIFGNINQTKKRSNAKKLSFKLMSALLGCTLFLSPIKVSAQGIQTRSMDNQVNYTLAGETDGVLDYARTDFTKEDSNGIHLTVTKWAKLPGSWGGTDKGPYNGRFLLNFFNDEFYTQIESITVNGVQFEKEAEGALWKVPINNQTLQSGLIGVITNTDVVIKLKNGATLDSLGLASKKIDFTTVWVRSDGKADKGGYDNGFILKNNPNVPTLPTDSSEGNENYLGTGLNSLENDGTKSKDGNFSGGHAGKMVSYDAETKTIKSTVSFKPDQNFLQANSAWVLYINEVIPQELLQYIDTDNVTLGYSTSTGTIKASNPIKLVVDPNGNGVISTKDTPELSIVGGDWNKVTQVRSTLDSQVFYGALGQRRSYTIEYKLKSNVTNQQFAEALNNYITTNNQQLNFESWLTADFVDSTNAFKGIRKPDGGKPNKIIQNTYSTAFLQVLDTDKDGLYDFVEDEIGTDKFNVDTDGDGVADTDEQAAGSNPKDPNSRPAVIITPVPQPTISNPTQTVVDKKPITSVVINPGNPASAVTVDTNKLPNGVTYDPTTKTISGTPNVTDWGTTEESRKFEIPVVVTNPDGSKVTKIVEITVQRDTDGDGDPDVTDPDDDNDGYTDVEETAKGTDPKDPNSKPTTPPTPQPTISNPTQTVIDEKPISNIVITPGDPASTITVDTTKLPNDVTYDPTTKTISGTPDVTDWGTTEESRKFEIPVVVTNSDGTTVTKNIEITVQRDTDGDGDPDVTDLDDDNDGYTDVEEVANGTDPKDANSKPTSTPQPNTPSTPSVGGGSSTVQKTPQTSDATNLFGHAASMTFFGTLLLILAFVRRREQSMK